MVPIRNQRRAQAERDKIVAVCDGAWVTRAMISPLIGIAEATLRKRLMELEDTGKIARREMKLNDRWTMEWRTIGPDFMPPLYESEQDAAPLASCWMGYTFVNGEQPCQRV